MALGEAAHRLIRAGRCQTVRDALTLIHRQLVADKVPVLPLDEFLRKWL